MPTDSGPLAPRTQSFYRDLAAWMAQRRGAQRCPIFGINGAQGSGKSTAARFLQGELSAVHGLRAVALSLDDFYLPRAARHARAQHRLDADMVDQPHHVIDRDKGHQRLVRRREFGGFQRFHRGLHQI